jgi:ABC-type branched-subunit amino acid transport system ATPase component
MVAVGGMGSLWGGLAGAALLTCLPELLHRLEDLHVLLYGLILMSVLVYCPQGLVPAVYSGWGWIRRRRPISNVAVPSEPKTVLTPGARGLEGILSSTALQMPINGEELVSEAPSANSKVLELHGVSLAFGGLQALQGVSLEVRRGEIVALIGPNGAGKTTLLNLISGLLKPQEGDIRLGVRSLAELAPYAIAACGVGRTFQTVQIYQKLTVLENVLLGYHVWGRSGLVSAMLHTPGERREEARQRASAMDLLERLGMERKAHWAAQKLSLLEQKLVELARSLALSPTLVLLDEPVGGLNPRESKLFMGFIAQLRRLGMGILVVEHDMDFVMQMADRIVVLNHGARIAAGAPREIQQNQQVIAAYLGRRK